MIYYVTSWRRNGTSHTGQYGLALDQQHQILAVLAGRMRMANIRIVAGDKVRVALSPYDLTRGRIVWRVREGEKAR